MYEVKFVIAVLTKNFLYYTVFISAFYSCRYTFIAMKFAAPKQPRFSRSFSSRRQNILKTVSND